MITTPASRKAMELRGELARRLPCDVRFDDMTRILYSTDASNHQVEPLAVAFPEQEDHLEAILNAAVELKVPVLPRGAGTSLAGQAVGRALIVDCSRHLRTIHRVDPDGRTAEVGPGVTCSALNAAVRSHGLMFGPDPASGDRATFGGMVGNNASGSHSIRYGMTADHLLEADVLLSDGTRVRLGKPTEAEVQARARLPGPEGRLFSSFLQLRRDYSDVVKRRWPRTWRRASGYSLNYLTGFSPRRPEGWYAPSAPYPPEVGLDLAALLCGSEGTLAIVRRASVRLVPVPSAVVLAILSFPDVESACDATPALLARSPSAVELIPRTILERAREVPGYARKLTFLEGDPGALLVIEFTGDSLAEATARAAQVGRKGRLVTSGAAQADLWAVREAGLGLLMLMPGDVKPVPFIEDVAVPVERLGEYVREVNRVLRSYDTSGEWYAHASAGCLHLRPLINLKSPTDRGKMTAIASDVADLVVGMQGVMSGEHGDGISRTASNARLFGPEIANAFAELKRAFDPLGLLNPGKVVPAETAPASPVSNLRLASRVSLPTHFAYTREGDFGHAVDACNGQGACLKMSGVMCPSFQATHDEAHSTRGCANALRAVLSGGLLADALGGEDLHSVLDLCLECKACKSECPSAVDMARLKAEYLSYYQAQHGVPLRSRLFGEIAQVTRLAQPWAPMVNRMATSKAARRLLQATLGISSERSLPRFARERFSRWFARREPRPGDREVVLFVDTYTETFCPEVGKAAVFVLEACGCRVTLARGQVCCGRPMISKGLLNRARQQADLNLRALQPQAARGVPIVGLEPSCILALRDEYLELFRGDPRALAVAASAVLIEEYLTAPDALGRRPIDDLPSVSSDGTILFHGHCHTKSLVGTAPMQAMLERVAQRVQEVDSGCCGMAGSFGYEAEHVELSRAIGELKLFPAIRSGARQGATICAAGISCRTQIADGTGAQAVHPIEVVARSLAGRGG
ncbi:MAG: FAD-binding protein [Actinobacteria bacterium]|nr:FAD-binding protein [Actinomycetota bacterium]